MMTRSAFPPTPLSSRCVRHARRYNPAHVVAGREAWMISTTVNGRSENIDADADMPLLWAIREKLGLTGTKFGCGVAQCGACTVHVDGQPVRSCVTPVAAVTGKKVTTIEGLDPKADHPLQRAWVAAQVPQCGYCQSGQIMSAAALLRSEERRVGKECRFGGPPER